MIKRKDPVERFRRAVSVGQRVAFVRERMGLSQEVFAERLIITREQVANHESGRTPLKLKEALRICAAFIVSEKWLATGEGLWRQSMDLSHDPEVQALPAKLDFANAYDKHLKAIYESWISKNPYCIRFTPSGGENRWADENALDCFHGIWSHWVNPPYTAAELLRVLIETGNDFCATNADIDLDEQTVVQLLAESGLPLGDKSFLIRYRQNREKNVLTKASTSETMPAVKSHLKNLLARANRIAKRPGKMSELADFLSAPLASVSRWLSGKREPGGETTLRLLRWVEQQERN